jgi:hypothetical protein
VTACPVLADHFRDRDGYVPANARRTPARILTVYCSQSDEGECTAPVGLHGHSAVLCERHELAEDLVEQVSGLPRRKVTQRIDDPSLPGRKRNGRKAFCHQLSSPGRSLRSGASPRASPLPDSGSASADEMISIAALRRIPAR